MIKLTVSHNEEAKRYNGDKNDAYKIQPKSERPWTSNEQIPENKKKNNVKKPFV